MATQHKLKIWPAFFEDVASGSKKYEIRKNDRGFKLGDELMLQEWNPNTAAYSGRSCLAKVVHITFAEDLPFTMTPFIGSAVVMGIEVSK